MVEGALWRHNEAASIFGGKKGEKARERKEREGERKWMQGFSESFAFFSFQIKVFSILL